MNMTAKEFSLDPKAKALINSEYFVWLTTVDSKSAPQPRPVWFIWDEDGFLIFSQPQAFKVKHIQRNPNVSLHFNADSKADENVVIFQGIAQIDLTAPPAHLVKTYLDKYKTGIKDLGSTPEEFSQAYSVAVRIKPTSTRS
jgi:PPOX class probable F420-dependent enzyme